MWSLIFQAQNQENRKGSTDHSQDFPSLLMLDMREVGVGMGVGVGVGGGGSALTKPNANES